MLCCCTAQTSAGVAISWRVQTRPQFMMHIERPASPPHLCMVDSLFRQPNRLHELRRANSANVYNVCCCLMRAGAKIQQRYYPVLQLTAFLAAKAVKISEFTHLLHGLSYRRLVVYSRTGQAASALFCTLISRRLAGKPPIPKIKFKFADNLLDYEPFSKIIQILISHITFRSA